MIGMPAEPTKALAKVVWPVSGGPWNVAVSDLVVARGEQIQFEISRCFPHYSYTLQRFVLKT